MQKILAKGPKFVLILVDVVYALLYCVYSSLTSFSFSEGSNFITEFFAWLLNTIIGIFQWILSNVLLGRFLFSSSVIVILVLCNFFVFIFPKIWANRQAIKESAQRVSTKIQQQRAIQTSQNSATQQQTVNHAQQIKSVPDEVKTTEGQMNLF